MEDGGSCLPIPTPSESSRELLKALDIGLPHALPNTNMPVVTRKKLPHGRKPR